jgi:hypothetical protein
VALLTQSIAIPLIGYMRQRAIGDHAIPAHWWPLLHSLYLWQLWHSEMPLADWRYDVVTWLYQPNPLKGSGTQPMSPDTYAALCSMHSLWMLSPLYAGIPLECWGSDDGSWIAAYWPSRTPWHLDQLALPLREPTEEYLHLYGDYLRESVETVMVTTLIEYAVNTYGEEQLPVLLASLATYDDWETLIPAVYGVSSAEFEEGWHAYLVSEYKVQGLP